MDRTGAVLVDTYRIERLIAEGGMGAVYEASHLRIPKKFAVKFLKVSLLDNSIALLRFRREAEVIATLDNPHIVTLFDYNITEDGVPYTVLEYLEGEHLGDRVARGRLPLADVLRISEAVAGALAAAHDKGVVHRDLKPENVILCTHGAVKVVDFGIAKLRGGQELTAFNSILGTITYMAPEQLMAGQIDARADQFALGAIVYEMLSGDMPFGSEGSIPEIAERVLRQQPPPIPGYPQPVLDVLLRAMSKEADKRYANVAEFSDALKEVARPLLAAPPAIVVETAAPAPAPAKPLLKTTEERPMIATPPAPATMADVPAPVVEPPREVTGEQGLPELPGEQTAISSSPTMVALAPAPAPVSQADIPTGETEMKAETTRITRSDQRTDETPDRQVRPVRRIETATGRMAEIRHSIVQRLGRRGGIAIGVVIGVTIVVLVSALLR